MLTTAPAPARNRVLPGLGIALALAVFCAAFVLVDGAYYRFANARFPNVGSSAGLATLWGIVSRAHLLLLLVPLVLWRPRLFGFQLGSTARHWRMLLLMLLVNCGLVAGFLILTHSTTPYSGNQWLVTEAIIVPLVEETFWRGVVFTALLLGFRRLCGENTAQLLAVWLSGVAFGLLHAANAGVGVPAAFVALQAASAVVWGVMYGYARSRTDSVYGPMLLHSAMNLVVVLL